MYSDLPSMRQRSRIVLGGLLMLALVALLIAGISGSVALSAGDLWHGITQIWHGRQEMAGTLLQLRLERAGSAFVTGAMLALAGVLMQALLRNPLADPYVLGVSGGAAVGALLAMLLAGAAWMIDAAAFGGEPSLLLLTGVIVASGCGALVTLMLSLAPESSTGVKNSATPAR